MIDVLIFKIVGSVHVEIPFLRFTGTVNLVMFI